MPIQIAFRFAPSARLPAVAERDEVPWYRSKVDMWLPLSIASMDVVEFPESARTVVSTVLLFFEPPRPAFCLPVRLPASLIDFNFWEARPALRSLRLATMA